MAKQPKPSSGRSMTSPELAASLLNEYQVLVLRSQRYTFDEIAKMVGYASRSGAYDAYRRAQDRIIEDLNETAEDTLTQELHALDMSDRRLYDLITAIENNEKLDILQKSAEIRRLEEQINKNRERRARYLGLDAAQALQIYGLTKNDTSITVTTADKANAAIGAITGAAAISVAKSTD